MSYLDKDLMTIHEALTKKEVTVKELIKESLEKIEKYNHDVNAFNLVLKDAQETEVTDNILSGIPYALKDNLSTKDIRTTACSNTASWWVIIWKCGSCGFRYCSFCSWF